MKKIILKTALAVGLLGGFAQSETIVNGVAFLVNGEPVTILELIAVQQGEQISKNDAIDMLINKRLHEEEAKRRKIYASEFEIEEETNAIARANGKSLAEIKEAIKNSGLSWDDYSEQARERIVQRKLYAQIVRESMRNADENELLNYYRNNQKDFIVPSSIEGTKYTSKNNVEIEKIILSGGTEIGADVKTSNETINPKDINQQAFAVFAQTENGAFTPIFPENGEFSVFLIRQKGPQTLLNFEEVRGVVLSRVMSEKEDYFIYEHFEKMRSNAKVEIIRLN